MVDKFLIALTVVTSLTALAGSFENYTNAPLGIRFIIIAIAGALLVYELTRFFARWIEVRIPARPPTQPARTYIGKFRMVCSIFCLAALIVLFNGLARWNIDRYVLEVTPTISNGEISKVIYRAPIKLVNSVQIDAPNADQKGCIFEDGNKNSLPSLQFDQHAWSTAKGKIRLARFVWPQIAVVKCQSSFVSYRQIHTDPSGIHIASNETTSTYKTASLLIGVLLWLGSTAFLVSRFWR
ncbi:hypothetical protein ACSSV1_003833 [Labrenzia sp. MBR-25]